MLSVRIAVEPRRYDELIAELWEAGTLGVAEGDGWVDAFFDDAAAAARFGAPVEAQPTDWVGAFEESFAPVLAGEKFFIAAPWRTEPTPPGRFRLVINPGAHSGTGHHPCTQMCLAALEQVVLPGDRVLDVGTGSGILAKAAKLLGAGLVISCDIDSEAVHECPFFAGSVDSVRSGAFDVVVANISDIVIGELKPEFERVARRRILSGFTDERGEWTCVIE